MFELDADDAPVVFDAPFGRIVEARAIGQSTALRVHAFYRETLPQMGWRAAGPEGTFTREGELLRLLVVETRGDQVEVRFSLAPAPGSARR